MLVAVAASARILGREAFGEFGALRSTLLVLQGFTGWGADITATRSLSQSAAVDPSRAGRVAATALVVAAVSGAVLTVLALILAPWICRTALGAPALVDALRVGALSLVPIAVSTASLGALTGVRAFRLQAGATVLGGVALLLSVIAGARAGGLRGAFLGLSVGSACLALALWSALHIACRARGIRLHWSGHLRELHLFRDFGLPAYLSVAMVGIVNWVCIAHLARQPSGFAEVGAFNAANQWFVVLALIPVAINQAILPTLSSAAAAGDLVAFDSAVRWGVAVSVIVVGPPAAVCALAAPQLMALYGEAFVPAANVLAITAGAAVMASTGAVVFTALLAAGRPAVGLAANLAFSGVLLALTVAWVDRGASGLALAQLAAYAFHAALMGLLSATLLRSAIRKPRA